MAATDAGASRGGAAKRSGRSVKHETFTIASHCARAAAESIVSRARQLERDGLRALFADLGQSISAFFLSHSCLGPISRALACSKPGLFTHVRVGEH